MDVLRSLNKAVKDYKRLLINDPEGAKEYKYLYMKDIDILMEVNETYIDYTSDVFYQWTNASVDVFMIPEKNIFLRIKKWAGLIVTNHYLNSISYKLSMAEQIKKSLEEIKMRFVQFNYLT